MHQNVDMDDSDFINNLIILMFIYDPIMRKTMKS